MKEEHLKVARDKILNKGKIYKKVIYRKFNYINFSKIKYKILFMNV